MKAKGLFVMLLMTVVALNAWADNTVDVSDVESESSLPNVTSEMSVDFPTGADSQLRRAIIDFIYDQFQSIYQGVELEHPSNTCSEAEFKAYLDKFNKTLCQLTAEDRRESFADSDGGETDEAPWYSNLYINKVADTDQYVSFTTYNVAFSGGAHEERSTDAVTIRKADGAVVSNIFADNVEEKMQPLLWKYLIASENPDDPEEYRAEINRFLEANYGQSDYLHLPADNAYLAPDGVYILYQPLEICFWPGEPVIVIPPDEAKPYLTSEAARLLGAHPNPPEGRE